MNRELTNNRLVPQSAIIVYKSGGEYSRDYYLETREIIKKGSSYEFAAPVPMSDDKMKDIAAAYIKKASAEMNFEGIVPDHILYANHRAGNTLVIWYRKAHRRALNFASYLKIKGMSDVILPATLYVVHNSALYVFAMIDDARPTRSTKLYHAPFFNIYEPGNVCLGTAPIGRYKAKTFEAEAERFERGFYMAEQNGGMAKPCNTPLAALWTSIIKTKAKVFPGKKELVQHKKYPTVGELMDKFTANINTKNKQHEQFEEEDDEEDIEIDL